MWLVSGSHTLLSVQPRKNFRIYTRKVDSTKVYDYEGKLIDNKLYAFKDGAQPVDCWCLKADYAESSGTHNTGIARLWNKALYDARVTYSFGDGDERNIVDKTVLRTNAQQIAADNGYPYDVRTTIDGFPILLFYRLSSQDELIFIGKYNFNNDKSTESVFGFTGIPDFNNEKMQCWEVLNNGNPLALFTTADGFDTGWSDAFEARYPDGSTKVSDLKAFCTWMSGVSQEDFATQKWEHLDVYKMAAYWIYLMRHAGADQFVKNAMFTSEDGVKWYYILYDNDTINGLINTGRIAISPTDGRQTVDATGSYVFAGHDSRLWNMLEADEEFNKIVSAVDNALYSAGISYINTIRVFDDEQADKWVERVYNQDAQYKYIGPFIEKGVNNLFMLQGKRDLHRKWWLAKRYSIFDARYVSGTYKSQAVELKCINGTPEGQQFTIKAGMPLDYGYGINNVPKASGITLNRGESYTFTTSEVLNVGDPVRIYGAPNIEELDLSEMASRLTQVNIAGVYDEALGTMLKKLVIGKTGVENLAEFAFSGLAQAKKLEYLDIQGIKNIKSLDLSKHFNFKTLVADGSGISSVTFAKGAPVESISLPSTMTNLSIEQLPYLESNNISFENIHNVDALVVKGCPKVSNDFSFVYNWYKNKNVENTYATLIMDNIDWKNVDADKLAEISGIGNLDLKGKVVLSSITLEQLNTLIDVFGETAFDKNSDFFINAPNAIFVTGRTELLEGESENYDCVVFGGEVQRLVWSIYSGGSSYTSINTETGVLTTTEGMGNKTLTIRVTAVTDSGSKTKDLTVTVKERVYPSSSQTTISGSSKLESAKATYQLAFSVSGITGDMIATWTLSGMDGYAEIESYNDSSCVVKKTAEASTVVQGTLSCALKKRYNNADLFTITKTIEVVNEHVAETDTGIVTALYNAGLCANPSYITKEEALLVTDNDLHTGTSYNGSIFYPQRNNIKSFEGFKYFKNVKSIVDYVFYECSKLTSVTIPEGVTSIGLGAFEKCYGLTSITIPSGVTSIRNSAFYSCSSLTSIIIPSSVTSLGEYTFSGCPKLKTAGPIGGGYNIEFGWTTAIPSNAFHYCPITSITIPEGVTSIRDSAFYYCSILTSVTIPSSVTSIEGDAFYNCSKLASITIPEGVTSIGYRVFYKCSKLTSITIPSTVTSIGYRAFESCTGLTSVSIPEGITRIENSTFQSCSGLTSITIPSSVTSIGKYAFSGCTGLTSVSIPNSVTSIEDRAFQSCSGLTSITIPSSVTSIGEYTFSGCTSLTSITIPSSVTSIGWYAFGSCYNLEIMNCLCSSAPSVDNTAFGSGSSSYTGKDVTKTKTLYVPAGATGYDTGAWLDPLQNAAKCGFTLSATL